MQNYFKLFYLLAFFVVAGIFGFGFTNQQTKDCIIISSYASDAVITYADGTQEAIVINGTRTSRKDFIKHINLALNRFVKQGYTVRSASMISAETNTIYREYILEK